MYREYFQKAVKVLAHPAFHGGVALVAAIIAALSGG